MEAERELSELIRLVRNYRENGVASPPGKGGGRRVRELLELVKGGAGGRFAEGERVNASWTECVPGGGRGSGASPGSRDVTRCERAGDDDRNMETAPGALMVSPGLPGAGNPGKAELQSAQERIAGTTAVDGRGAATRRASGLGLSDETADGSIKTEGRAGSRPQPGRIRSVVETRAFSPGESFQEGTGSRVRPVGSTLVHTLSAFLFPSEQGTVSRGIRDVLSLEGESAMPGGSAWGRTPDVPGTDSGGAHASRGREYGAGKRAISSGDENSGAFPDAELQGLLSYDRQAVADELEKHSSAISEIRAQLSDSGPGMRRLDALRLDARS